MQFGWFAVALAAAALVPFCGGTECTLIGCEDGVLFTVTAKDGRLGDGRYTLRFQAAEVEAELSCSVSNGAGSCESTPAAGGWAHDGVLRVILRSLPTNLEVSVSLDDAALGTFDLEPEYTTSQPNGPACEPTCVQGTAVVEL